MSDRVDALQLSEGRKAVVTVTRTGTFTDPRYGTFEISRAMLDKMVRNFEGRVYGQDIALDVAHRPEDGAAGWFRRLFLDGNKLRAEVEFTDFGIDAITQRGFRYISAEFSEDFADNETGLKHGCTLLGAGLTVRPVIKRLDPVELAEASRGDGRVLLSEKITRILTEEFTMDLKELIKKLAEKLGSFKLAEAVVAQLLATFEDVAKKLGEDKAALNALFDQFETTGKALSEASGSGPISLNIKLGEESIADLVTKQLAEMQSQQTAQTKQLAERTSALKKIFTDTLEAATGFSDDLKKELAEAAEIITPEMTNDQVRKLAERQIKLGEQVTSRLQLAGMGYPVPGGDVRITMDESNTVKALQEHVDRRLGLSELPESRRYRATGGQLQSENKQLAEKVLSAFDRLRAAELHGEHKLLAAGDGLVSDVAVPATFERTVIREALYSLVGLQFVDSGVLDFAPSHLVPYSYRDTSAAGRSSTRVYEGRPVPRAGVIQTSETAYPLPQKLAFEVSDELRYLTSARRLDWDAVAENARNAVRIIGEDTEQLIFNEVLHAADEFGAVPVVSEALTDVNGTNRIFALANFPVVRPRRIFDLQGNQVGNASNPVTVMYGGTAIQEYMDGASAGTYYVLDCNLGEIRFVDEAGNLLTPPDETAIAVSYSYATNVHAFDTDLDGELDVHWDGFLYRYGLRKSVIEDDRYHLANFGLMSGTAMTQVEQAKQFGANSKRAGTDLSNDGNLGRVKDVANFKTSAPGLWMGDQRIIIGERGVTRMRLLKPWTMSELENQKDENGRFTGKKEAYGDQFMILHTPTQLKRAYTSLVLYSSSARVNRAA